MNCLLGEQRDQFVSEVAESQCPFNESYNVYQSRAFSLK